MYDATHVNVAGRAIFILDLKTGEVLAEKKYNPAATDGQSSMFFAITSTPAVLDLDSDGFADVIYVGDLGGQVWKWDISAVGTDGVDADTLIDNWTAGRIFAVPPVDMGTGLYHHRQFYHMPRYRL